LESVLRTNKEVLEKLEKERKTSKRNADEVKISKDLISRLKKSEKEALEESKKNKKKIDEEAVKNVDYEEEILKLERKI
jgi:hypothetical protein